MASSFDLRTMLQDRDNARYKEFNALDILVHKELPSDHIFLRMFHNNNPSVKYVLKRVS